jgi:2-methylisocitrate lyase-like PEP mutase family enzyme
VANPILRQKLQRREFLVVPGLQDMISAVIANEIGFDAVYGSGYWLTASAHGLPDAGISSVTQMVDRMTTLVRVSDAPVIADADTGFGGLLNVHHTVRAYEAAGVSALQLEDQEFPKKCGHTPYKRVVPAEEMARRIQVACEARTDPSLLVIARTDARQSEGLDGVLRRLERYAEAGADILFPEALTSVDELATVAQQFDLPLLANMATGGVTPMLSAGELRRIGYSIALYPALASLACAEAARRALAHLKFRGGVDELETPLYDFGRFCERIGFLDVWAFERRWHREGS